MTRHFSSHQPPRPRGTGRALQWCHCVERKLTEHPILFGASVMSSSSFSSQRARYSSKCPMATDKEEECYYEAVTFLHKFHSRRASLSSTPRSPLGAIAENRIVELSNNFSLHVALSSATANDSSATTCNQQSSWLGRSPNILKRSTTSAYLVGLDKTSSK